MVDSVADWTMHRMQLDLIFGVGAFFLYILVPVALLANEVRLAKQSSDTSGSSAVLDAMAQAGFFIISWLLFVTIFIYLVVGVAYVDNNPVIGIYDFWHVDWLNPNIIDSLEKGEIFKKNGDAGRVEAQSIAFFLSVAKVLEILLLGVMLLLTVKLSMWLPLYKMRRTSHSQMTSDLDIGSAITYLMMFTTGMILFNFILGVDNMLIDSIFRVANNIHGTTIVEPDNFKNTKPLNILDDLWILLRNAREAYAK